MVGNGGVDTRTLLNVMGMTVSAFIWPRAGTSGSDVLRTG